MGIETLLDFSFGFALCWKWVVVKKENLVWVLCFGNALYQISICSSVQLVVSWFVSYAVLLF